MDGRPMRIDFVDVRLTDDDLTLVLGATGVEVMLIRLRYDGEVDEVITSGGSIARGPSAWTLIDHELTLDFDPRTAEALGLPRDCRLRLEVDDDAIRQVRSALLEILQCACFVVDTIDGRIAG